MKIFALSQLASIAGQWIAGQALDEPPHHGQPAFIDALDGARNSRATDTRHAHGHGNGNDNDNGNRDAIVRRGGDSPASPGDDAVIRARRWKAARSRRASADIRPARAEPYVDVLKPEKWPAARSAFARWWGARHELNQSDADRHVADMETALDCVFFDLSETRRPDAWEALPNTTRAALCALFPQADSVPGTPMPSRLGADYRHADRSAECVRKLHESTHPFYLLSLARRLHRLDGRIGILRTSRPSVTVDEATRFVLMHRQLRQPCNATRDENDRRLDLAQGQNGTEPRVGSSQGTPDVDSDPDDDYPPDEDDMADEGYAVRRSADLAAMLFAIVAGKASSAPVRPLIPLTLDSVRDEFNRETAFESHFARFTRSMFNAAENPQAIHHDGLSLHNANGKSLIDLVKYVEQRAPEDFRSLSDPRKEQMVARALFDHGEYPHEVIGTPLQTMLSILMRFNHLPPRNHDFRHFDLELSYDAWTRLDVHWLEHRDFPTSPDLYAAAHLMRSSGVSSVSLEWYRVFWESNFLGPLQSSAAELDARQRTQMWRWVQGHATRFNATTIRWNPCGPREYVSDFTRLAETLYEIKRSGKYPRYVPTIFSGWGYMIYHPLLAGLDSSVKRLLTLAAATMDFSPLRIPRILTDDWIETAADILDYGHQRGVMLLGYEPAFYPEPWAYLALIDYGLSEAQILHSSAQVVDVYQPELRQYTLSPYEAILSVLRTPHWDNVVVLPNGRMIKPHQDLDRAYKLYKDQLPDSIWINARAHQNVLDRGEPPFPGRVRAEKDRLIEKYRQRATKYTVQGQADAEFFFGSLPVTYPLMMIGRNIRDGRYEHLFYYLLTLGRDILAMTALGRALYVAYWLPFTVAARQGAAYTLAGASMLRFNTRIDSAIKPAKVLLRRFSTATPRSELPSSIRRGSGRPVIKTKNVAASNDQAATWRQVVQQRGGLRRAGNFMFRNQGELNITFSRRNGPHFSADQWSLLRLALLPQGAEAFEQFAAIYKSSEHLDDTLAKLELEQAPISGMSRALLGVADCTEHTRFQNRTISARSTIKGVTGWLLRALDDTRQDIFALMRRNMRVEYSAGSIEYAGKPSRETYSVLSTIIHAYNGSALFRALYNWYDNHAVNRGDIRVYIDVDCTEPAVAMEPEISVVQITLPLQHRRMPFVCDEQGMHRLSPYRAVIETSIAAFIGAHGARTRKRTRTVATWLANAVQVQIGDDFKARIDSIFHEGQMRLGNMTEIRTWARIEDEYIEKFAVVNYQLSNDGVVHGHALSKSSTVQDTLKVLRDIDYAQVLDSTPEDRMDAKRPDFLERFDQRFSFEHHNVTSGRGALRRFATACYENSSLFSHLFDRRIADVAGGWLVRSSLALRNHQSAEAHVHWDAQVIDAFSADWLYLGLSHRLADSQGKRGFQPLRPIQPERRFLEGLVAVLIQPYRAANSSRANTVMHEFDGLIGRGAAAWIAEVIFLQGGWDVPKRLAGAQVRKVDKLGKRRLLRQAGRYRRIARAEDDFIMKQLDIVADSGRAATAT